jgi:two-component system, NarL family, response regulator DesR
MIRIVIAEDQELILRAIGSLLNLEEDMEVVGQAENGEEALTLVKRLLPDVCIMDIEMPEKSGLEAAEALKEYGCKIIVLTTFARNGYFQKAINAGVSGYLLKDSPSEELACSIRRVMKGKTIYSPELMDIEFNQYIAADQITQLQSKKGGTVRNYISTFLDKIKLPTG